jgi:hypothetical protein
MQILEELKKYNDNITNEKKQKQGTLQSQAFNKKR